MEKFAIFSIIGWSIFIIAIIIYSIYQANISGYKFFMVVAVAGVIVLSYTVNSFVQVYIESLQQEYEIKMIKNMFK